MKILMMLTFTWLFALTACSGSSQGRAFTPASVTLRFATNESGQLEIFNAANGSSYGTVTTGTLSIGVLPGTALRAVWTPATSDTNTAAYWLDSTAPNTSLAAGASEYDFTANSSMTVQMHLLAPPNVVQMIPSLYGVTSWALNGVLGQVVAGGASATISVRESDDFQVMWNANGSGTYISVWDISGPTLTDRTKKDLDSTAVVISAATTISADVTAEPIPHWRLQIARPLDGEIDFVNPQSGNSIALIASDPRYGANYEVLTDNTLNTTVSLAMSYKDDGSGHALASYTDLAQTINVTTTQGTTPNSDSSLTFANTWNCVLANSGADVPLSFSYDDAVTSCTKIGQLFTSGKCYDGVSYCAALNPSQSYNGTSCY